MNRTKWSGIPVENDCWLTSLTPKAEALAVWTRRLRNMTQTEYNQARKPIKLKSGSIHAAEPIEPDGETPPLG